MGIRLERQGEDSGQGGHSARPAAPDLRRQAAGGWPHALGLQHPEGVDAPPRAAPPRWWPQVQPVEEGALEDALEVEEEAHPPPPAQAQEDAPALQVSALLLTARPRAEYQQDGGIALTRLSPAPRTMLFAACGADAALWWRADRVAALQASRRQSDGAVNAPARVNRVPAV